MKQSNEWEWNWYKWGEVKNHKKKKETKKDQCFFSIAVRPTVNATAFASLVLPWTVEYVAWKILACSALSQHPERLDDWQIFRKRMRHWARQHTKERGKLNSASCLVHSSFLFCCGLRNSTLFLRPVVEQLCDLPPFTVLEHVEIKGLVWIFLSQFVVCICKA